MKKKQVIVVKKLDKMSPKKEIYVSKKVQNLDLSDHEWKESFVGNLAPQRPTRDAHENILSRSILGDPKVFESFVDMEDVPPSPVTPVKRKTKNSEVTTPTHVSNKKKSVLIQPAIKLDPKIHPGLYLESLQKLKMKAGKLRDKEIDKETKLIQYLPVNERFDLNKEGKVLAMWQERQKKWAKIQKSLAKRVGGTTESLMMNTGDEFRARNEEYDVLQAAIPVHERFGAESWKMMLRDGTERSVSIGHVFSGLSCPISIKSTIPAIIRKPRVSGPMRKSNTFIDPTPSLLKRQKQLQKTLQTLRPHSLGPLEVEGFFIPSQNLFDWAIKSSENYFQEKQDLLRSKSTQIVAITPEETTPSVTEEYIGPQITFLSPRNILFSGLQGETVHQTITFKNTGSSAVTFIWKSVPEKELHEPSEVAQVMSSRTDQPRAHILSRERSPFFCSHPFGQILPGDTIETVFSFCSKGCGGNFLETWILDTLPRAVIHYPPTFSKPSQSDIAQTTSRSLTPLPSTVYVKLKGHSHTSDEGFHRREAVCNQIEKGALLGDMIDQAYLLVRTVRRPVTKVELSNRKVRLFKEINKTTFQCFSPLFENPENIKLTTSRLDKFIELWDEVARFGDDISSVFYHKLELLQKSELTPLSGISKTNVDDIIKFSPLELIPQMEIRNLLFPELTIETFDEITEDLISSNWNYSLAELTEYMARLLRVAQEIQSFEEKTEKNLHILEKARILAERKAQDSDYEDEEDEEPEPDESEEFEKPQSVLCQQVKSFGDRLKQLVFLLLIEPLPQTLHDFYSALAESLDEVESFQEKSLEHAGLKGDLIISPIMSPYTTEEGNETWQGVLSSRQPVTGKKPPASKAQKGYASDEQRKKYYLSMYEMISAALLDGICNGLSVIDSKLNNEYERKVNEVGYSSLQQCSSLRQEDLKPNTPVFLIFNGDCFGSLSPSAFDVAASLKYSLICTLYQIAEYGANLIVLLFESINTSNAASADAASEITTLIGGYITKLPKRKNRQILDFTSKYVSSMAELNFYLENQNKIQSPQQIVGDRSVTILVVDNLLSPTIVPKSPNYVEELSDDEDDSIPIGLTENKLANVKAWESLEPRDISVSLQVLGKSCSVNCLTDAAAAINRLISQYNPTVIQGHLGSCFPVARGVLKRCNFLNALVTNGVRDSLNWLAILLAFPKVPFSRTSEDRTISELYSFGDYLSYLFSHSISGPSLIITIGGTIKSTKFRFLENAIDMANTIVLSGEFCVPFLLASGISFKHAELYAEYKLVCANLLAKARLRGVTLQLPVDLVIGDVRILPEHCWKSLQTFDKDSRDEGLDYEGEVTVITCESSTIPGYPLDLGPLSCQNLRNVISQHHLHLCWGTVGCSEFASFQSGQRALVEGATRKNSSNISPRNIIFGESTVEWWSRICDSDGEFEGDLVRKGVVDCLCRDSLTFISTISHLSSPHIPTILQREPNSDEWDYLTAVRKDEEQQDEDDEEDETED